MQFFNREKERIPSTISLNEFGEAMQSLDLESVPPHKRKQALMDHLTGVMVRTAADKTQVQDLAIARAVALKSR